VIDVRRRFCDDRDSVCPGPSAQLAIATTRRGNDRHKQVMIRLSIDISPPHRINPMLPNTWAKRSASLPK
jgi:hypothetical protein